MAWPYTAPTRAAAVKAELSISTEKGKKHKGQGEGRERGKEAGGRDESEK